MATTSGGMIRYHARKTRNLQQALCRNDLAQFADAIIKETSVPRQLMSISHKTTCDRANQLLLKKELCDVGWQEGQCQRAAQTHHTRAEEVGDAEMVKQSENSLLEGKFT